MKVIGLTGGIASGKSTVSKALTDMGAVVIDGDKTAHRLMEPHQPLWEEVINKFGQEIVNPDLSIDRAKLGSIVFNEPEQMAVLNKISRPWISKTINSEIEARRLAQQDQVLVLDIPLLYEAKMDKICDKVWVVWVDRETQIRRLMKRDGYTREEAEIRINSQMSLDEKAQRADVVIDNTSGIEETLGQATRYYLNILQNS